MQVSSVGNMAAHDLTTFGGRVESALDVIGKKKTELADHLGISKQALSQILTGQRPGYDQRQKIADYCDVSLKWLVTGSGAPDWAKRSVTDTEDRIRRAELIITALTDQLGAAKEEIAGLRSQVADLQRQRRDGRDGPRAADR